MTTLPVSPRRLALVATAFGIAAAVTTAPATAAPPTTLAALPTCPDIFAHGGYPTGANPWQRDQVRAPNSPAALAAEKARGASGVEADVQLTKNGTKAVMWHNDSTRYLTGERIPINELWWNTGADRLNGRTITRGPYAGEVVYTLRQYLDAAAVQQMVPLIEIKGVASQSLLNSNPDIRDRAWKEVLDPVRERIATQEIMLYSRNQAIQTELVNRATAPDVGLDTVVAKTSKRPAWPDTVEWEEPPPSWAKNEDSWNNTLNATNTPERMATSWPSQMRDWLVGKCV